MVVGFMEHADDSALLTACPQIAAPRVHNHSDLLPRGTARKTRNNRKRKHLRTLTRGLVSPRLPQARTRIQNATYVHTEEPAHLSKHHEGGIPRLALLRHPTARQETADNATRRSASAHQHTYIRREAGRFVLRTSVLVQMKHPFNAHVCIHTETREYIENIQGRLLERSSSIFTELAAGCAKKKYFGATSPPACWCSCTASRLLEQSSFLSFKT